MEMKKIFKNLAGFGVMAGLIGGIGYLNRKFLKETQEKLKKQSAYYALAQQWLVNKNEGKSIDSYFKNFQYKNIAIYGIGTLGELFFEEIKHSDLKISYFIDKNCNELFCAADEIATISPDQISSQEQVDAIIVTPISSFDEITDDLIKAGVTCEIVSLEDVIYDIV